MLKINTIYTAIEGEGINVGLPQIFIRLQGCKVGCKNCDTLNSWDSKKGIEMSVKEIYQRVIDSGVDRVSITGGNPLEQDIYDLVELLQKRSYFINIEATGQDFDEEVFDMVDFISCDIKTPSTGVKANLENVEKILEDYGFKTQIKCVCADQKDLDFIVDCYRRLRNQYDFPMVITPCWTERDAVANVEFIEHVMNTILTNNYDMRVICQQHKFLFGSRRGDI